MNDSVEQEVTADQNNEPLVQIDNDPLISQDLPQNVESNAFAYDFITKMIEEKLNQALENLNLTNQNRDNLIRNNGPSTSNNLITQQSESGIKRAFRNSQSFNPSNGGSNCQHRPGYRPGNYAYEKPTANRQNEARTPNAPFNSPSISRYFNNNNTSRLTPTSFLSTTMNADKITSIIQNWGLKFDGANTGLNVEEFLYRLTSLTNDNFEGDFGIICRNLHILLTGKARDWFWRYHKQERGNIDWVEFCDAIRSQYKDFKSSFDIREEIRNRKQKPGEKFEVFYESISAIMDRLPSAFSDVELIEILIRNLRPEIRQELLYIPVHSISHLRKLVQMRENFLEDEYVRRNFQNRNTNIPLNSRNILEIELDNSEYSSVPVYP